MNNLCAIHLPTPPPARLAPLATPHRRLGSIPRQLRQKHRPTHGPLRPNVFTAVRNFLRCGDLASGFLRFHCPDFDREQLFNLKADPFEENDLIADPAHKKTLAEMRPRFTELKASAR